MRKEIKPLFSVIIPNFNGEKFIEECLESVLKSRFSNFEVLVYDDASSDASVSIIRKLLKKDRRIKFTVNPKNLGAAATRNIAINKAKGKIIVFLDNDTVVDRLWLTEINNSFKRNLAADAIQCCVLDYEKNKLVQHNGGLLMPQTGWLLPNNQWQKYNKHLPEIPIVSVSCALAVKKSVFDTVIGFDQNESVHSEDVDLSWRMWISGFCTYSSNKAVVYHWHKSLTQRAFMHATLTSIYFHLNKNSLRSIVKNYEIKNVFLYLPICLAILIARALILIANGNSSALIGFGKAIIWNGSYLKDTLKDRKQVQYTRKISDKDLFKSIFVKDNLLSTYNKFFR